MPNKDLFQPVVPLDRLHPSFKILLSEAHYSARAMMKAVFEVFRDKDGNFVEQFQSTGFDARVWELYLFAFLHNAGYQIDWTHDRPDFIVANEGKVVCLEAVTTNPPRWQEPEPTKAPPRPREGASGEELAAFAREQREKAAFRLGAALKAKLGKRYWELPQVTGRPLVLAIEAFHDDSPARLSDGALIEFLFGRRTHHHFDGSGQLVVKSEQFEEHIHKNHRLQAGFFFGSDYKPDVENVSAVLFSNAGTVPKFDRMGIHAGHRSSRLLSMMRVGMRHNHDPNAVLPLKFSYSVGESAHTESWEEGIAIIHNPNARIPLPDNFFGNVAEHRLGNDGSVVSTIPDFHPYASVTYSVLAREGTSAKKPNG